MTHTQVVVDRFDEVCGPIDPLRAGSFPTRQCLAAAEVLEVDGAGISLLLEHLNWVPLGSSGREATVAERLQFTLGHGPCLDAHTHQQPSLVPDIADRASHAWSRWPGYAEEVLARTCYRAVFAFPLASAGLRLGTLNLYRREPGPMSGTEIDTVGAVAGRIFDDLVDNGTFDGGNDVEHHWLRQPLAASRVVVWQAIGMATIGLGLVATDALALLRAYAYTHDRLLDHVAVDVVSGRIPLDRLHP